MRDWLHGYNGNGNGYKHRSRCGLKVVARWGRGREAVKWIRGCNLIFDALYNSERASPRYSWGSWLALYLSRIDKVSYLFSVETNERSPNRRSKGRRCRHRVIEIDSDRDREQNKNIHKRGKKEKLDVALLVCHFIRGSVTGPEPGGIVLRNRCLIYRTRKANQEHPKYITKQKKASE